MGFGGYEVWVVAITITNKLSNLPRCLKKKKEKRRAGKRTSTILFAVAPMCQTIIPETKKKQEKGKKKKKKKRIESLWKFFVALEPIELICCDKFYCGRVVRGSEG